MDTQSHQSLFLKEVFLSGYKSINEIQIELEKGLNIIIGKNAAGKTNFLKFLYKNLVLDYDDINNFSSRLVFKNGLDVQLTAAKNIDINELFNQANIEPKIESKLIIGRKTVKDRKDSKNTIFDKLQENNILFSSDFLCHGVPKEYPIVDKSFSFKNAKNGISDITNLFLTKTNPYFLKCLAIDIFSILEDLSVPYDIEEIRNKLDNIFRSVEQIKETLFKYSPIQDIRFSENYNVFIDENKESFTLNNLFLEFKVDGSWLPFSNLSDGTKRLFFIISEVSEINTLRKLRYSSSKRYSQSSSISRIILIEEPELGIHPHQFHKLMEFLKEQSQHKQIIISTHSPQALDSIDPNEFGRIIIAYSTNSEEGTKLRHLNETELIKANEYIKEDFLSDYWLYSDLEK